VTGAIITSISKANSFPTITTGRCLVCRVPLNRTSANQTSPCSLLLLIVYIILFIIPPRIVFPQSNNVLIHIFFFNFLEYFLTFLFTYHIDFFYDFIRNRHVSHLRLLYILIIAYFSVGSL